MLLLIEGPDGAGKTTIAENLQQYFRFPRWKGTHRQVTRENVVSQTKYKLLEWEIWCNVDRGTVGERHLILDRFHWPSDLIYRPKIEDYVSPLSYESRWFEAWFKEHKSIIIYVYADPAVLVERVTKEQQEGKDTSTCTDYITPEKVENIAHAYAGLMKHIQRTVTEVVWVDTTLVDSNTLTNRLIDTLEGVYDLEPYFLHDLRISQIPPNSPDDYTIWKG